MFTAVTTFFSGMISSFVSAHSSSSPLSFTILAPNGQLIQAPKGLFFDFIAGYLIGIDTPLGRRWPHIFSEVYLRTPNSPSHRINFPLLPSNTFTGNMQGGHVDFSGYGLEFILTVMLVYVNRLKGIDLFAPAPINVGERREMIDDIHFNNQDFLNYGFNWALFNGYTRERTGFGGGTSFDYMRAWIDYGFTIIEQDAQFNEMLTMALNEDGIIEGTGTAGLTLDAQGTTLTTPPLDGVSLTVDSISSTNAINASNQFKFGLGALILILFLTFKK